ncbi:tRNA (guanine(46)-N(7))-methyltransferase TrmB [Sneathiella marina]|uniref:tRNA (guanine-N(7)-)-methyltransferase n=1 Tax=Sneathiella marina TaxID=2950108 RepID=A0ABY4W234_9PROT|nr:tRNA (guanine(46)-N(7))-methyltransferase TrmB [Sneathiella marina]USG61215.1 tRNA (guanine(46)-N(7))-methyltransferase TrmB [Sneathiella marina]
MEPNRDKRILYGRRRGKPLRKGQQALIEHELPGLLVPMREEALDLAALFGSGFDKYWLEVGFGSGEHLAWQAHENPDTGILGCEPFINGVATLLGKLKSDQSTNVRIHPDAAEPLIGKLPENTIDRCFVLFADPWPKSNHNKRRFVSTTNIAALARVMKSGAELRIATDHVDYGAWILWHMLQSTRFDWIAETPGDWRVRSADWPPTRYEQKAIQKGLKPVYYRFRRNDQAWS